jgi:1-acyl-sn-glycerol-3-phosphate acyltransferase
MTLLRSALFNVYFFGVTFAMTLVPATAVRFLAPDRVLGLAQLWARIMLWGLRTICGVRFQVFGLERIDPAGASLIASQHQSAFDTIVWFTLLPRCCYVLKRELLSVPLLGPLMPLAGMIAVDRRGGASALRGLIRQGDRAVRERRQIVIFPEGTRAQPGEVLPLQPGVAALAARTGLAVIPVVTDSGHYWGRRAFQKRPGTIHIRLLQPIPAGTDRAHLMQRLADALQNEVIPSAEGVENSVGRVPGQLLDHDSMNR